MKKLLLYLLEVTAETLIQKTGERALKSGLYKSGNEIIPLAKLERFPPSTSNLWTLVVSV
jgi:hypothetical protein